MHIYSLRRSIASVAVAAGASFLCAGAPAHAALNWEGQSGVFLNTLAYPLGANKLETAYHYVDLGKVGAVHAANITYGVGGKAEIGYTRVFVDVSGLKDQNLYHAKYQFVKETKDTPAVAVWALHRDHSGPGSTTDYGVVATKILSVIQDHPVIVSLGARSTQSLGQGVYGIGERELRFDGAIAVFVTKKVIAGAEFRQQVGSKAWGDLAVRYVATENLTLDLGLANLGDGFRDQLALGVTWAF